MRKRQTNPNLETFYKIPCRDPSKLSISKKINKQTKNKEDLRISPSQEEPKEICLNAIRCPGWDPGTGGHEVKTRES